MQELNGTFCSNKVEADACIQAIRQAYQDEERNLNILIDMRMREITELEKAFETTIPYQWLRDKMLEEYADYSGLNAHMERKAWLVRKLHGGL